MSIQNHGQSCDLYLKKKKNSQFIQNHAALAYTTVPHTAKQSKD